jgi:hypothetical protein
MFRIRQRRQEFLQPERGLLLPRLKPPTALLKLDMGSARVLQFLLHPREGMGKHSAILIKERTALNEPVDCPSQIIEQKLLHNLSFGPTAIARHAAFRDRG